MMWMFRLYQTNSIFCLHFYRATHALHGLCDRNSVCPAVCILVHCVHMVQPTTMISSPYSIPIILVSGDITIILKFEGGYPERGRWMRVGWVRIGDFRPISRCYDKGYYWSLIGNRIYALSIGTKINDLGWPWNDLGRQLCTPLHYTRVLRSQPLKFAWR